MALKRKFAGCVLLFAFSTLALWGIDLKNYNDGQAVATYYGTTRETCIEKMFDKVWEDYELSSFSDIHSINGKLSKAQQRLYWAALDEFDYSPGEIYLVCLRENESLDMYFLVIEIMADGGLYYIGEVCNLLSCLY